MTSTSTTGAAHFTFSETGTLAYVARGAMYERQTMVYWVDRQGTSRPLSETPRVLSPPPRLSPDGRRLAVVVRDAEGSGIMLHDLERGTWTRLTTEGSGVQPVWSPDGSRVTFTSERVGVYQVFAKAADGSGNAEQLTRGPYRVATSMAPDGRSLVFRERRDDGTWDIGILHLDGDGRSELILDTEASEHTGMISPDGRWLAYVSNEPGREEIYVTHFPKPMGRWPISTEGGAEPMWSRDGTELFYRNGDKMMVVAISTEPDFAAGRPTLLFEGDYLSVGYPVSNYDVTADGREFVMIGPADSTGNSQPTQLHVVLNWFQELERRVP